MLHHRDRAVVQSSLVPCPDLPVLYQGLDTCSLLASFPRSSVWPHEQQATQGIVQCGFAGGCDSLRSCPLIKGHSGHQSNALPCHDCKTLNAISLEGHNPIWSSTSRTKRGCFTATALAALSSVQCCGLSCFTSSRNVTTGFMMYSLSHNQKTLDQSVPSPPAAPRCAPGPGDSRIPGDAPIHAPARE